MLSASYNTDTYSKRIELKNILVYDIHTKIPYLLEKKDKHNFGKSDFIFTKLVKFGHY